MHTLECTFAAAGGGLVDDQSPSDIASFAFDVLVVAQQLEQRYRHNGRPYLAYCARAVEGECHSLLDLIDHTCRGWEPVNR